MDDNKDFYFVALGFTLALLMLALLFLGGCSSKRTVVRQEVPVYIHDSDSVRTEYVERVRIDTVTVRVEVPRQEVERVTRDTVSHLETDFAVSSAWVLGDGSLGHWLRNKEVAVEREVPVVGVDSHSREVKRIYTEVPVEVTREVTVEVERSLTWWERFRLGAFWWLVGAVAVIVAIWIHRGKRVV